ncbi:MAG: hypothetical protein TREMPRED_001761 [Tremellales sp. Tagirdzhanova-0007]|nr:MAG: hypothetical protein TREMPRED_001761 [Tremellales sp. Tagirdzhanova-0007]
MTKNKPRAPTPGPMSDRLPQATEQSLQSQVTEQSLQSQATEQSLQSQVIGQSVQSQTTGKSVIRPKDELHRETADHVGDEGDEFSTESSSHSTKIEDTEAAVQSATNFYAQLASIMMRELKDSPSRAIGRLYRLRPFESRTMSPEHVLQRIDSRDHSSGDEGENPRDNIENGEPGARPG